MTLVRTVGQSPMLPGAVRFQDLIITSGIVAPSAFAGIASGIATPFETQAAEALSTLLATIEDAGGSRDTIIKLDVFVADEKDFAAWNAEFLKVWPEPGPARTTIVVGFAAEGILIELQAVAAAT